VTVCVVRMSRGGQVARELLGESFSGILGLHLLTPKNLR
jgi:hypothetical protein